MPLHTLITNWPSNFSCLVAVETERNQRYVCAIFLLFADKVHKTHRETTTWENSLALWVCCFCIFVVLFLAFFHARTNFWYYLFFVEIISNIADSLKFITVLDQPTLQFNSINLKFNHFTRIYKFLKVYNWILNKI